MATIEQHLTEIYVFVDDYLKAHPELAGWRTSPNHDPALSDAEVITIGLMQNCLGVATLKKTYTRIALDYPTAVPHLCSYQQWLARLHRLGDIVGHLVEAARVADGYWRALYLIDAKPIPVCKPIRHGMVRLLRDDGAYFGKSSTGWFFGFKLHVLMQAGGHIVGAVLTAGNVDDRQVAVDLGLGTDGGIIIGDEGYVSHATCEAMMAEADAVLLTPREAGDKRALVVTVRKPIETLFSLLWSRFIDRVYSRSWRGLWTTIKLKLASYNLTHAGLLSA
jgi:hypothetical protein